MSSWTRSVDSANEFPGRDTSGTWKQGIVPELRRLGCVDARILDIGAGTESAAGPILLDFERIALLDSPTHQSPTNTQAGERHRCARVIV